MNASNERVHYYHADASPVGGHLTHPIESVLHTQASVSLSPAGGQAAARVENYKLDHIFHCGAAYSHVAGTKHRTTGNWTTQVTSVVEHLNVLDILTVDRIVARLSIEHPSKGYHPKVTFLGSQFQNLRIAGKPIDPVLDFDLFSLPAPSADSHPPKQGAMLPSEKEETQAGFPAKPWTEMEDFVHKSVAHSVRIKSAHGAPEWLKRRFDWIESPERRRARGCVLSSLVPEVTGAVHGSCFGHVIHVPSFGNVFLGELIVDHASFRLTMLRIEMGCIADGDLSFGTGVGNGHSSP